MKKTADGFVWLLVTEKAKEIWSSGLFSLFILYEDDSESLIEEYEDLDNALANGLSIGVEVGFVK
jgi:hypothetical protein